MHTVQHFRLWNTYTTASLEKGRLPATRRRSGVHAAVTCQVSHHIHAVVAARGLERSHAVFVGEVDVGISVFRQILDGGLLHTQRRTQVTLTAAWANGKGPRKCGRTNFPQAQA